MVGKIPHYIYGPNPVIGEPTLIYAGYLVEIEDEASLTDLEMAVNERSLSDHTRRACAREWLYLAIPYGGLDKFVETARAMQAKIEEGER